MTDKPDETAKDDTAKIEKYIKTALQRKAENIKAIAVGDLTSYTDIIIIITGRSARQVTSVAEHIHTTMKKQGILPLGVEGIKEGKWALLDFGDVIIHVFDAETRALYDIEGLWSDAPELDLSRFTTKDEQK